MAEDGAIDRAGFDLHVDTWVWTNWRAGTWGICVHDSRDIRNIARKTVAVERLQRLTGDGTKTSCSPEEAREVRNAAEYDAIVPPFSPHDRHEASRARRRGVVRSGSITTRRSTGPAPCPFLIVAANPQGKAKRTAASGAPQGDLLPENRHSAHDGLPEADPVVG